jgi:hypothetical protein
MQPNNLVLNALASLCEKLSKDERFAPEKRKEAQEMYFEHKNLVEDHAEANTEARAGHLGMSIVLFLAGLLQIEATHEMRIFADCESSVQLRDN